VVIDTLAKVRDAKGYEQPSYEAEYATASDIRIGRRQRERARVRLRAAAAQQTGLPLVGVLSSALADSPEMLVAFVTIRWPASGRLPIVGPIHAGLARKPAGHRTTVLDDDYWSRWLAAVALRPDLPRLVKM
jgi:hypothetical protein